MALRLHLKNAHLHQQVRRCQAICFFCVFFSPHRLLKCFKKPLRGNMVHPSEPRVPQASFTGMRNQHQAQGRGWGGHWGGGALRPSHCISLEKLLQVLGPLGMANSRPGRATRGPRATFSWAKSTSLLPSPTCLPASFSHLRRGVFFDTSRMTLPLSCFAECSAQSFPDSLDQKKQLT